MFHLAFQLLQCQNLEKISKYYDICVLIQSYRATEEEKENTHVCKTLRVKKNIIPVSDCDGSNSTLGVTSSASVSATDVFEVQLVTSNSNFGAKGFCFRAGFKKPQ